MSAKPQIRLEKARARSEAILDAAAAEFVANGFAAARVEDIAARAGVAKGTVYLNFADKHALFEAVVKRRAAPIAAQVKAGLDHEGGNVRATVEALLTTLLARLSEPATGDILRLVVSESIRFPALTGFYRREIIAPVALRLGQVLAGAAERGELTNPATARYPHLVIAPLILALIAQGGLQEVGIDDLDRMLEAHLDTLFSPPMGAPDRTLRGAG